MKRKKDTRGDLIVGRGRMSGFDVKRMSARRPAGAGGKGMTVREHGSLDLQKLLRVLSEILSDRYKVEVTVTAKTVST